MRTFFIITLFFTSITVLSSCGNTTSKSGDTTSNKVFRPKNFDEAYTFGYSDHVFEVPDTIFLGFHWGMTKEQVNEYLKKLQMEKKIYFSKGKYRYKYGFTVKCDPLYNLSGQTTIDGSFSVECNFQNDTLSLITLLYSSEAVDCEDLYREFGPVYEKNGYFFKGPFYFGIYDREKLFAWEADEKSFASDNYMFIKNNTLIWIDGYCPVLYRGYAFHCYPRISYYNLTILHEGHAKRMALIKEKEQKEKEKNAKDRAIKEASRGAF